MNGIPIGEKQVVDFVVDHQGIIEKIRPSFFEMTVAMAFEHFAYSEVDMAIIETGLGGRLDSTNIITPQLSIITNISRDHTEFLGEDLLSIAREKSGIIKEQVPLVVGNADGEIDNLFQSEADKKGVALVRAWKIREPLFYTLDAQNRALFRFRNHLDNTTETHTCDLTGHYQQENLASVLSAIDILRDRGWGLPSDAVSAGIADIVGSTGILGRWQTLGSNPRILCDTAHNRAGIQSVTEQLATIPRKKLHMVWGMVTEKEPGKILPLLPTDATYYFTRSSVPRAMNEEELHTEAGKYGLTGHSFPSVYAAYREAKRHAEADDLVFIGGSTFVVADLLKALGY